MAEVDSGKWTQPLTQLFRMRGGGGGIASQLVSHMKNSNICIALSRLLLRASMISRFLLILGLAFDEVNNDILMIWKLEK